MAYGLYLALGQKEWFRNDFSSDNKLTGTIYTDINQTTAKDLTGYTINVKFFRPNRLGERFDKAATAVVAANGTWEYAVAQGEMPPANLYHVKVELTKSGAQESTLNRVELLILRGAAD
jgi:hypothetical protein